MTAELLQAGLECVVATLAVILMAGIVWKLYRGDET